MVERFSSEMFLLLAGFGWKVVIMDIDTDVSVDKTIFRKVNLKFFGYRTFVFVLPVSLAVGSPLLLSLGRLRGCLFDFQREGVPLFIVALKARVITCYNMVYPT